MYANTAQKKKHCSQANSLCQTRTDTCAHLVCIFMRSASENRSSAEQAGLDMNEDHLATNISIYHPIKMHHIVHL